MLFEVASLGLLAAGAAALPSKPATCSATTEWPGWANLQYAFTFGDSYTQTGFETTLTPPSPTNPLGNPAYPGYTSSNGPNWVDYLTFTYNATVFENFNLAYGGATVNSTLVAPYDPSVISLQQQVEDEWVPAYTGSSPTAPSPPSWSGNDTLFFFWIGINDVGNSYYYGTGTTTTLNAEIFAIYAELVDTIYAAGRRNFVFLNVPPVDRSPLMLPQGADAIALEHADLAAFNGLVQDLAKNLTVAHPDDANAWVFDANALFNTVLDDPASFPQTAGYQNTTGYCVDYENGTAEPDTLIADCGIPVNEYFWLNTLHPTYPMHEVVAQQLSLSLAAGPNVC